jgi:hypothetical protein
MYKCNAELAEARLAPKTAESARRPFIAQRLRFEALALRDQAEWLLVADADALRALSVAVARELVPEEQPRFAAWVAEHLGLGLARAAGLQAAPPRLVVSA